MWISIARGDAGGRAVTGAGAGMATVNFTPPPRPGLFPSRPSPPALPPTTATTAAPASAATVAAATAPPPPAGHSFSPLPSVPQGGAAARLPVPPPSRFKRLKIFIKAAKKERKRREERPAAAVAAAPAEGHPRSAPPGRRSFRLAGGAPDPGCGRALLPLWLEESNGASFPVTLESPTSEAEQELSFERRWDSLRNNKVHSCLTQRPPGWDDVSGRCPRVKKDKKSSFCPSVVIQEPGKAWPASPVHHRLPAPPASARSRTSSQRNHRHDRPTHADSHGTTAFSRQPCHVFSDQFVQVPVEEFSSACSLETESTCTSEGTPLPEVTGDVTQEQFSVSAARQSYPAVDMSPQHTAAPHTTRESYCSCTSGVTYHLQPASQEAQQFSCTSDETHHSCPSPHEAHSSFVSSATQQPLSVPHVPQQCSSTSGVTQQLFSSPSVLQDACSKSYETQTHYFTSDAMEQSSTISHASQSPIATAGQQSPGSGNVSQDQECCPSYSDRQMWLSSDSFFCEDFTFNDIARRDAEAKEHHESASELHMRASLGGGLQPLGFEDREGSEEAHAASTEDEEEGMALSSTLSPYRLNGSPDLVATLSDSSDTGASRETLDIRCADVLQCQHWVAFESSPAERWTPGVAVSQEIVPSAPTLDDPPHAGKMPLQATPPGSPPGRAAPVKHRASPTNAGSYSGRLIRTYSQRGRRASKRVISTMSRRMSASEYGRLPESRPPMYSRAAMTMQSGPGLFEDPPCRTRPEHPREEEPLPRSAPAAKLSLPPTEEPNAPRRAGSVRAPRLPAVLLRRSASLAVPCEDSSKVPFQRLTEQRPGSFRRVLGALARSFRRKSNKATKPDAATNSSTPAQQSVAAAAPVTNDTQTPQAPRLPRRAATHTYTATHDCGRPVAFV